MKRLIVVLCVAGLLAALSMSHLAFAGKPVNPNEEKLAKVDICHATDSAALQSGGTLIVGHVINVSENAVDAHLAHGDSLEINDIDDEGPWAGHSWRELAEWYGLNTAGANCAARLP